MIGKGLKLPPCLNTILANKDLLNKYYYLVLRYVKDDNERFATIQRDLYQLGIKNIDLSWCLENFKCEDVPKELCKPECPYRSALTRLKPWLDKVEKVLHVRALDGNDYLVLYIDDKRIKVRLDREKDASDFLNAIASEFHIYINLDRRRVDDRDAWTWFMNALLARAEVIDESKYLTEHKEDDIKIMILECAKDHLYTSVLVECKDVALLDEATAYYNEDEGYAYMFRDNLIKRIESRIHVKVSPSLLSRLLTSDGVAEPARLRVRGIRRSFYRFKPMDHQVEAYMDKKKVLEKEKNREEGVKEG